MTNPSPAQTGAQFSCLLLGLAVGCGMALLLAPYSGRETRKRLRKGIEHGAEQLTERAEAIRQKSADVVAQAENLMETGKKKLADQAGRVEAAVEAGKKAFQRGVAAEG